MKKVKFFSPLRKKKKKENLHFFGKYQNISSHVLKISAISLVLRTREITDIFNTFNEIYLVFPHPQSQKGKKRTHKLTNAHARYTHNKPNHVYNFGLSECNRVNE